jgi:serine/threonine protein kinase
MLQIDPKKRITAREALKHPYFAPGTIMNKRNIQRRKSLVNTEKEGPN